jgi:hypothetical protein
MDKAEYACETISVKFEIIGKIEDVETIAVGTTIRDLAYLKKAYGRGRWRKLKGVARVKLPNGRIGRAEIHWYEAHGIGRKDLKIKHYLD